MRYGSTPDGIVRGHGDRLELLDLPFTDVGAALAGGITRAELDAATARRPVREAELTLTAPVARPGDVWAAGRSYRDHAEEASGVLPERSGDMPELFLKASSSVTGPRDPILLPSLAAQNVDYEGEIAVIVGREATSVDARDAWDHVFGITAANDVSARDVQSGIFLSGLHDFKGKSFDTFTPLGPWIVTPDELDDRDDIGLQTIVNGEVRQSARTSQLVWPVATMIATASRFATLSPGDVILTGTPAGVGAFAGKFLRAGDEVRVEVQHVGSLINVVRDKRELRS